MPDWENYKGVEIPEATPTGAAGLRLKDNFIYVADQLETLQGDLSGLSINDLAGVNISSPTTGEALIYNGSDWANAGLSINDLAGVDITSPTTGEALIYDGSDWTNAPATGGGLAVTSKTNNYTAAPGDLVYCNVTGGSFTVSLPAVTTNSRIGVKLGVASGSNTVTISPKGTDKIDNQSSVVLYSRNDYIEIQGDATSGQWIVLQNNVQPYAQIWVHSPGASTAGYGTTNTKIRRYTVNQNSVGSAITYADSATLGSTFTINQDGLYFVVRADLLTSGAVNIGLSKNSTQLSISVGSINDADKLGVNSSSTLSFNSAQVLARFSSGDVIRPHEGAALANDTSSNSYFRIIKVAN